MIATEPQQQTRPVITAADSHQITQLRDALHFYEQEERGCRNTAAQADGTSHTFWVGQADYHRIAAKLIRGELNLLLRK